MTLCKRALSIILAVCAFSTACIAGAAEASQVEPVVPVETGTGGTIVQPMNDYVLVDHSITKDGASWSQPWGYGSYRVWVENTTKLAMSVTITYSGNKTRVFSVPAGKSETYVVNDATYGSHKISFKTVNNVLSGTVRVRVSDMTLS